jgi:RND family efflux transporter MFP subunit
MSRRLPLAALLALGPAVILAGCDRKAPATTAKAPGSRAVHAVPVARRTIERTVMQPGRVDAFEQTSIYPKMTAYLEKWNVDIGDRVKKGQVLATLFVPELLEEHRTKQADVALAGKLVAQSEKALEVADAEAKAAEAELAEAKANLGVYQAAVDRWKSEVARLAKDVEAKVVSRQVLDESARQLAASTSSRDAAQSAIDASSAALLAKQAAVSKAAVDIEVQQAQRNVAESEERRLAALVGYLELTAPYDGIVVARTANTGDFVLPATGDPSASMMAADTSAAKASPIYVVARTDILRVFVDIPERDANHVAKGTKAQVIARAYRDEEIEAEVTRTSWALNVASRTLRAEIDLPNPDEKLLPGMYAYGQVLIRRPDVFAIPLRALDARGEQSYCWLAQDGRATRFEIEVGVSDGSFIEVTNRRPAATPPGPWAPFDGSEHVILGDLTTLEDGEAIAVEPPPAGK